MRNGTADNGQQYLECLCYYSVGNPYARAGSNPENNAMIMFDSISNHIKKFIDK